jgi:hypothetical protein
MLGVSYRMIKAWGLKFYRPVFTSPTMHPRYSRRVFPRADDAMCWGRRAAERFQRLIDNRIQ